MTGGEREIKCLAWRHESPTHKLSRCSQSLSVHTKADTRFISANGRRGTEKLSATQVAPCMQSEVSLGNHACGSMWQWHVCAYELASGVCECEARRCERGTRGSMRCQHEKQNRCRGRDARRGAETASLAPSTDTTAERLTS